MSKIFVLLIACILLVALIIIKSLLELKPRRFIEVEIAELINYMYLLLYRGFTNRLDPDGVLFVVSYTDLRKIILRKYNNRNKVGLYLYFPIYDDSIRLKAEEFLAEHGQDKKMWIDKIPQIREKVVGVNINQDIEFGYKMICLLLEFINPGTENVNFLEEVYVTNVEDTPNKFVDFEPGDIDNLEDLSEYINMPLTQKGRIIDFYYRNFR